jgi:LPS-assembly protein
MPAPQPVRRTRLASPSNVPEGWVQIRAQSESSEGVWRHLRGDAEIETHNQLLKADEIDYNDETGEAEARGHVYLQNFDGGDQLWADRADYDVNHETGKFYNVRGTSPMEAPKRPGILPSTNPFHFEGKWAERIGDKYILHDGFITNCKMPHPWWVLRAPKFDIIPRKRAITHSSVFLLRKIPIFYTPYFYKSLERLPRRSGLLTPNIGNSSNRGFLLGFGYYWAINRSYDLAYRGRYYTLRGLLHEVDLRGKPREGTEFNAVLYGIRDREASGTEPFHQGGVLATVEARSDLGHGFYGRGEFNYLSSLVFRRDYSETYSEAIGAEVHSTGFVARDWSSYGLNVVLQRNENFQSDQPGDTIVIRRLPEVNFSSRDHRIWHNFPVWISWESSAGLLRRTQLAFQTRQIQDRLDVYPRVMTAVRWKDFAFLPSFAVRETHYGESMEDGKVVGRNLTRSAREFSLAIVPPSLARVYQGRVKHVIEPRVSYRYVTGIDNFDRLIHFDTTEMYSNTNELELSLTNRIYIKRRGSVDELLTWQLWQKRYFDPTFGGAVTSGCTEANCRQVVLSAIELTPYAFLTGPRNYSPVVSSVRLSPRPGFGIEWRSDYDPLRGTIVNNSLVADAHFGIYSVGVGHNTVRGVPDLSPSSNQFTGRFVMGNDTRRGWNAAFSADYDFRFGIMRNATTQFTYNTDCCGFSIQYHRWSIGTRNENQFRVAFVVANVGSFGTLKKQDRMF